VRGHPDKREIRGSTPISAHGAATSTARCRPALARAIRSVTPPKKERIRVLDVCTCSLARPGHQ